MPGMLGAPASQKPNPRHYYCASGALLGLADGAILQGMGAQGRRKELHTLNGCRVSHVWTHAGSDGLAGSTKNSTGQVKKGSSTVTLVSNESKHLNMY